MPCEYIFEVWCEKTDFLIFYRYIYVFLDLQGDFNHILMESSSFSMINGASGSYSQLLTYLVYRTAQGIARKHALGQQLPEAFCHLQTLRVYLVTARPNVLVEIHKVRIPTKFRSKRPHFK